jgi:hypothetical protein
VTVKDAGRLPEDLEGVYVVPINSKCREEGVPRFVKEVDGEGVSGECSKSIGM